ncbi:nuclear transport factor 2 family protein [Spirosoma agri]|uniref:Nuclear transport factor 2 family protein n=1 Tax=Spirosoma agri TaxID=1987381 RepID=A0A6M0IS67_9BACT|nr:nuclear transport factor 2 family protein [Spirosoma agri]NEU70817.1 nuclear transport factor 2 family protein [Spirosoma agri]
MEATNKSILEEGNAAIAAGNNEGFLSLCSEDTEWTFVGEQTLRGKEAVRQWMAAKYMEPPTNRVAHLIAEGEWLTVLGSLITKDQNGQVAQYAYCDVWRFREGKLVELKAFVINSETKY